MIKILGNHLQPLIRGIYGRTSLSFSQSKLKSQIGDINGILEERRKFQKRSIKEFQNNLPAEEMRSYYRDKLCTLVLYMSHDSVQSQYIHAIMNYQKLGFQRVSDLGMLHNAAFSFQVEKIPYHDRWPILRFSFPIQNPANLKGVDEIYNFLKQHDLIQNQIEKSENDKVMLEYIDEKVVPALQSLFWHPRLTFQYTFYTNRESYNQTKRKNILVTIMFRILSEISKRTVSNIMNIITRKDEYLSSKKRLTEALRQLEKVLGQESFFSGEQPQHLDFYLFAILQTKINSRHFKHYLQHQVGKEFYSWYLGMAQVSQYSKERVTLA